MGKTRSDLWHLIRKKPLYQTNPMRGFSHKWKIEAELNYRWHYITYIYINNMWMQNIYVNKHVINYQHSKCSSCTSPSTWVIIVENAEGLSFSKSWGFTCPVWIIRLNCILLSSAWPVWASSSVYCWSNCMRVVYVATAGSGSHSLTNSYQIINSIKWSKYFLNSVKRILDVLSFWKSLPAMLSFGRAWGEQCTQLVDCM